MAQNRTPRPSSRNHRATAHQHRGGASKQPGKFNSVHATGPRVGKRPVSSTFNASPHARKNTGAKPRSRVKAQGVNPGPRTKVKTGFMQQGSHLGFDAEGFHLPTGNTELLITRRQLLYGAIGVGAVVALGAGVSAAKNESESASAINTLSVSSANVFSLSDCTEVASDDVFTEVAEYELPYGTLIWANSDTVAACLMPTETVKPLATVALLNMYSGNTTTVLENAVGQAEGYEIYDVRCCDNGIIWAEANILLGQWRVYAAPLSGFEMGTYRVVDSGGGDTEMPTIAAVGHHAFWQVIPTSSSTSTSNTGESSIKNALFTNLSQTATVYTAAGRMATGITAATDGVVITPRYPGTSTYRQLVLLDESGDVKDSLTLPTRMSPTEASYGRTGLMFCFESIYSYGDGIANLGTYTPASSHADGDYANLKWFRFGRTPTQPPAWCGSLLMVKSSTAVCGINLQTHTYAILSVDDNAEKYGDCLATTGSHNYALTYMNVDSTDASASSTDSTSTEDAKYCLVRLWEPA